MMPAAEANPSWCLSYYIVTFTWLACSSAFSGDSCWSCAMVRISIGPGFQAEAAEKGFCVEISLTHIILFHKLWDRRGPCMLIACKWLTKSLHQFNQEIRFVVIAGIIASRYFCGLCKVLPLRLPMSVENLPTLRHKILAPELLLKFFKRGNGWNVVVAESWRNLQVFLWRSHWPIPDCSHAAWTWTFNWLKLRLRFLYTLSNMCCAASWSSARHHFILLPLLPQRKWDFVPDWAVRRVRVGSYLTVWESRRSAGFP